MSYLIKPDITQPITDLPDHPYSFKLDLFQQHAIRAVANDENVLICAKTSSGKTLVAEYGIYHSLKKGKRIFYTTPIKSLSNQKFYDLKHQFPEAKVGIMTGDIKYCPDGNIIVMTTEILRNLLYKKGTSTEHLGLSASLSMDNVDCVIFDEVHFLNDKDRGHVWEESLILLPPAINMILLSATIESPELLANWLGLLKQKQIHLIETHYRIVPLTQYLLTNDYSLITLVDAKENYYEKVYTTWLNARRNHEKEKMAHERKVSESKRVNGEFVQGAVDGKIHIAHFTHQMNEVIKMLEKKELLPGLFFVLSRKKCEFYAQKVETTLLTSSDIASVKHIINFHLHRYMNVLEKVPQYHQIHDLLIRGIAFHHSGLLPILKEIVEILCSKGFIKIMFCTETLSIGLNMPMKTVLLTGLKKYDEQLDTMRMLRNDEYTQLIGRAGRRGKDDKGVVIYLPDREPVDPYDMFTMMKGSRPPILSRMDFHYDFILKTIQSSEPNQPLKWLQIMKNSYWFQQRQTELQKCRSEQEKCIAKMKEIEVVEPYYSECHKRYELEQKMKITVNASRKEIQSQLDTVKNKQLGPKWNKAWADYHTCKLLKNKKEDWEHDIALLENHTDSIIPSITFLYNTGYITNNNPDTLMNNDLTVKGILATEVNEGHPILMTELYTQEILHNVSGDELVSILSCFITNNKSDTNELVSYNHSIIKQIEQIAETYQSMEAQYGYPLKDYWTISTDMIEPMKRWIEGEHASVLCTEYNIFEGNFIRSVMKVANMLDEWLAMATYCQHIEQIDKITEVRTRLIRDLVVSDSLYLRL